MPSKHCIVGLVGLETVHVCRTEIAVIVMGAIDVLKDVALDMNIHFDARAIFF